MRIVFYILFALLIAIIFGVFGDRGYVLINAFDHTIETSLVVFIGLILFGGYSLWLAIKLTTTLIFSPWRVLNWRQERKLRKEKDLLSAGFMRLAEGRWEDAKKLLARHASKSRTKSLAYLGAALSAERLGDRKQRDEYLALAKDESPKGSIAAELASIQFDLEQQRVQKAFSEIKRLYDVHPNHPQVLRLYLKAALEVQEWNAVDEASTQLRKAKLISPDEARLLQEKIAFGRIKLASSDGKLERMETAWSALPHEQRQNPKLINHYAQLLNYYGHGELAAALLLKYLERDLDDDCLLTLSKLKLANPEQVLVKVEKWLKTRPHDDVLLLASGLVAKQARIWGKARALLESSVKHRPNGSNHLALADLLDRLEEKDEAIIHYRKGMELMRRQLPVAIN